MSASGLESTIAVAIDQILRLAPSSRPPIDPVVSSTNATSTAGFATADDSPADSDRAVSARAKADVCDAWHRWISSSVLSLGSQGFPWLHGALRSKKGRVADKFVAGFAPDLASLLGGRREIG